MDAVRGTSADRKAAYDRGFREWMLMRQNHQATGFPYDLLLKLEEPELLREHPFFVPGLEMIPRGNIFQVSGESTWQPGKCAEHIPHFTKRLNLDVSVQKPTKIRFEDTTRVYQNDLGDKGNHLGVLVLTWAYVLSARWAEKMPGAEICYTQSDTEAGRLLGMRKIQENRTLSTGTGAAEALRWWKALVAPGHGWLATISSNGRSSMAPWSTNILTASDLAVRFVGITEEDGDDTQHTNFLPPLSDEALRFMMDYCEHYGVTSQCKAALSAALVLPLARRFRRCVRLPTPQPATRQASMSLDSYRFSPSREHLDKLLMLSCNWEGMEAILSSCFFNPDIPGNVCSHYLQGIFAVIDSTRDLHARTSLLMRGLGRLGFLWLGASITGLQDGLLKLCHEGISEPELHSAAWTQTLQSFIQQPVTGIRDGRVARADECKLLFLTQTKWHTNPPLSAWPLFGNTELKDVNLEVEEHIRCGSHRLYYDSWTWTCRDKNDFVCHRPSHSMPRLHTAQRVIDATIPVSYHAFDPEEESASENATMNNFNWLRGTDGYPVAERDIRNHEWLREETDSDDIESEDSDQTHNGQKRTRTQARRLPTKWLLYTETKYARADSV